jgi:hypothetical protein
MTNFEHVEASLKGLRAVFVGAARDCAEHLPNVLENLAQLSALYAEASFVFAIGDSTDETVRILSRWMANRRGSILHLGPLELSVPLRTERLAIARNAYLDEARRSATFEYDHLVVADLDNVMAQPISIASFAAAARWLERDARRAGAFANSTPNYYDIWSLRHEVWCPHDCWHAIWYRDSREPFEAAKIREVFARQIAIPRWWPPIRVQSAFGGLGIYKSRYAKGARYKGADKKSRQISEHVQFNRDICRAGGSLHIYPSLTVQAPPEHLYRPLEFSWWWRAKMYYQLNRRGRVARWQKVLGGLES